MFINFLQVYSKYLLLYRYSPVHDGREETVCTIFGPKQAFKEIDWTVFRVQLNKINVGSTITHVPNQYSIALSQEFRT